MPLISPLIPVPQSTYELYLNEKKSDRAQNFFDNQHMSSIRNFFIQFHKGKLLEVH